MRVLFGAVSLLIALAVVGLLVARQARHVLPAAPGAASPISTAASGTVRQQSIQLQQQVANDVARALEQGAAARREESEK